MVAQVKLSSLEVLDPAVEEEMNNWYLLDFSHKEAQEHTNCLDTRTSIRRLAYRHRLILKNKPS